MTNVLLTGATGFIGSHLARLLLADGVEVHALLRDGADPWRIADILPELRIVHGCLDDTAGIETVLRAVRPEICLHLAWYAEPGKYLDSPKNLDLVHQTAGLALQLAGLGCRRFVGAGTCYEYDLSGGYLHEDTPTTPHTLYGAAKLASYHLVRQIAALTGMTFVWPRLFYLYGPAEDARRLVPSLAVRLLKGEPVPLTDGTQLRDFLHVEDVAGAIWTAAKSDSSGAVNVGSGETVTVAELARELAAIVGRPDLLRFGALTVRPDDPPAACADISQLRDRCGWRPAYTLRDGLQQTVAWWQERVTT